MKNLTTTIIAFFFIATAFANNTTPSNKASLSAIANNHTVVLNLTANSHFEVERSFYSNQFVTIASINNPFGGDFKINDNAAALAGRTIVYYRIKTIDGNGTVSYSNTSVVNVSNNETASPSIASVHFHAPNNGNAIITVKNAAGKTVVVKNLIATKGNNTVIISEGLAKGFYTATVSVNAMVVTTEKIIAE